MTPDVVADWIGVAFLALIFLVLLGVVVAGAYVFVVDTLAEREIRRIRLEVEEDGR